MAKETRTGTLGGDKVTHNQDSGGPLAFAKGLLGDSQTRVKSYVPSYFQRLNAVKIEINQPDTKETDKKKETNKKDTKNTEKKQKPRTVEAIVNLEKGYQDPHKNHYADKLRRMGKQGEIREMFNSVFGSDEIPSSAVEQYNFLLSHLVNELGFPSIEEAEAHLATLKTKASSGEATDEEKFKCDHLEATLGHLDALWNQHSDSIDQAYETIPVLQGAIEKGPSSLLRSEKDFTSLLLDKCFKLGDSEHIALEVLQFLQEGLSNTVSHDKVAAFQANLDVLTKTIGGEIPHLESKILAPLRKVLQGASSVDSLQKALCMMIERMQTALSSA
ncbi:MAG: hypothetical protein A2Y14_03195 [Verrucomicrobia bacterium GWF2_51_19]|nr:MAG: hypothetical protein A2Y14_03195 [Verrucomicrobia bacterium GWF2_51_19]HCJ12372.1 hypothetical protein [Opitutae bacterium]